ncbi:alpha/beta hydrolase [Legionella drancourtii]|uniref:Esterase n=1 Tax=Legionella drancourtii LLAP12 TaxID=658187 RepID=G9EPX0_9GAMM|nr:alpha/beta hydrolase-fold protein [Legionella drancourtii]EHL30672.1 hypothetical protein LDG_7311 [Legionella drancourtii LLAP12]
MSEPVAYIYNQGCGLINMAEAPTKSTFEDIKKLLNNKDAVILFKDQLFYADLSAQTLQEIQISDNKQDDFHELKSAFNDQYKLADANELKLITSLTGRAHDNMGNLIPQDAVEEIMEDDRILYIHLPPSTGTQPGVLILMDGNDEMHPDHSARSTPAILDELYQKEKIPNQVTVFIPPGPEGRLKEYACNLAFTEFLNKLPLLLQNKFGCSSDRKHTTVGGTSFGGLAATHAALTHPETFGNVLSQSGAFWWHVGWQFDENENGEWKEAKLPSSTEIKAGTQKNKAAWEMEWLKDFPCLKDKLPINFYLSGGVLEEEDTPSLGGESYPGAITLNNIVEGKLKGKGHQVTIEKIVEIIEAPLIGNHNSASWQSEKPKALEKLLSKPIPQLAVNHEKTKSYRAKFSEVRALAPDNTAPTEPSGVKKENFNP